ncbi:hypothetical protein CLM62_22265 [Streptomyces sp. SA15]|uniref:hypothetical protein n=1 Tax=Streptomyces sp. SA15 TaxID=934019 RepID=UPI000BAE97A9|nr:hypothetical protein [Streptomyces sp. SA15]PAZ14145.1 hypothetical protein CLM62_22265 [Streptomyces sp. SA15]
MGGWWNRQFSPEIHLIGADRAPVASTLYFAGSVKWPASPFDQRDLTALRTSAPHVPGFIPGTTGLAGVSLSGTTEPLNDDGVQLVWGPQDVLRAWSA